MIRKYYICVVLHLKFAPACAKCQWVFCARIINYATDTTHPAIQRDAVNKAIN